MAEQSNTKLERLAPETELERDLGISGDDFAELIAAFSERFGTDMSGYAWYFRTGPEGWSLVDLFFDPYRRIQIPVTIQMLVDSARAGRWLIEYPPHDLPRRTWRDFRIHPWVVVGFLLFLVARCAT